jgi:hypothetical protein
VFPGGKFDCAVLLGVIEYLKMPERVFAFAQNCATAMVVSDRHTVGLLGPTKVRLDKRIFGGRIPRYGRQ